MKSHRLSFTLRATSALLIMLAATLLDAQQQNGPEFTDNQIDMAVQRSLWTDEAVPSQRIDVSTERGVVTLSGTVDNLLARDRAVTIAETIKGVQSVVNRIEVSFDIQDDAAIRENVQRALIDDPATESYEVTVRVEQGVVTLTGKVDSWAEKRLCERVVKSVKGVRDVRNRLEYEFRDDRPDEEIAADIRRRLRFNAWVDDELIDVTVKDGRVVLSGTVGSAAEKRWAVYDAWVVGARDVTADDLAVQWWARDAMRRKTKYTVKADDEIADAVEEALTVDPRVFSDNVTVEVNAGTVTLTGQVLTLRAKQAAGSDARNTVGVRRVRNRVEVRTPELVPDARVTENVERALGRDPYLDADALAVTTRNGVVRLSGVVDSQFERSHAADVTRGVSGVLDLQNNLLIRDAWSWKSDFEIREDIRDRLEADALLEAGDITVEVNEGEVTLVGMVDTWHEKSRAGNIAQNAGASRVHNNLVVRYGPPNTGREYFGPYYEYDTPYVPEPFGPGPYGYGGEGYLP